MKKRKTQKIARARKIKRNSDLAGCGVSLAWTAVRRTKSKTQQAIKGIREATKGLRMRR